MDLSLILLWIILRYWSIILRLRNIILRWWNVILNRLKIILNWNNLLWSLILRDHALIKNFVSYNISIIRGFNDLFAILNGQLNFIRKSFLRETLTLLLWVIKGWFLFFFFKLMINECICRFLLLNIHWRRIFHSLLSDFSLNSDITLV